MSILPPVPAHLPPVPSLRDGENYHVFISHASEDVGFSRELKEKLETLGYTCFHSDDNFLAGGTIVQNIMMGVNESRKMVTLVSPSMIRSAWVEFECASSRTKSSERRESMLIPILYDIEPHRVPAYVKELSYVMWNSTNFWTDLINAISDTTPLQESIPVGMISHGFAWSYYYGYLSFVLPGLAQRFHESEYAKKGSPFLPKMMIVIPTTCKCPNNVRTVDPDVVFQGMIKFQASRSGKEARDYSNSVYKITEPKTRKEFYTVMEFASPLMAMYEMEQGRISNLDSSEKGRQMTLFRQKLQEILDSSRECRGQAILVMYNDSPLGTPDRLSSVLAARFHAE